MPKAFILVLFFNKLVSVINYRVKVKVKSFKNFGILGVLFLSVGCSETSKISFFCERDVAGNYILKWEVPNNKEGQKIQIYMSDNDSVFGDTPIMETNIDDCVAEINDTNLLQRKFFRLKATNIQSGIISNPFFRMEAINNFRDIGGYSTLNQRQIKWGKVYRTGDFSELTTNDYKTLQNLNVKTIIDFRAEEEYTAYPDLYRGSKVIQIPIASSSRIYIREKIVDGAFLRGDAILFSQDIYRSLIENYSAEYAKFIDVLCDETNYPIAFHSYLGKDRVGLASYYLLKALDVAEDLNEEDYMFTNSCLDKYAVMGEARYLPESMQEAATVACKTDLLYLNYAKNCMIKKSGSVNAYMEQELKLTPEKKAKLRKILLYN